MAGQTKKMVTGFNHNIKHRGQVFHVQTEDSGVDTPHIITHLFLGGNILASKKTSYADIVHAENLTEVVRALMEEQHKEMLRNLINGAYDEVIERYGAKVWQPGAVEADGNAAPPPPLNTSPAPPPAAVAKAEAATIRKAPPPKAPAAPVAPPVQENRRVTPEAAAQAAQRPSARTAPRAEQAADRADTIFGEDLISERSLDEVILSYLAEDTSDG
ncbi:MAG: hypothetical protein D6729_04180 [Deltaproteobacteria bacterium]|nr:MAG: hypothetical protein D6729_04180 [Deltaproteobacteria bacterium]